MSASRPVEEWQSLAGARSRAPRRATSCLQPAAPSDLDACRRARVADALAAGQLTIRSEHHDDTHLVTLVGELDVATAQRVEDELQAVEATNVKQIILDLAGLTFMDTSGVHLIGRVRARCETRAQRLRLLPGQPHIQRVLALAGTDRSPVAA
ncbi:MAG: STAS domain-containing protein [Solirubrobacterales bacterium]|nr:STAS domain-containing protein [Solirubrobacterales bacterium]